MSNFDQLIVDIATELSDSNNINESCENTLREYSSKDALDDEGKPLRMIAWDRT